MIIGSFGMSGTKGLRVTSIILILMGLASILLTYFLAHEVDASDITVSSLEALKSLILAYASAGFQVLVGLIGLILSKKRSIITVILGIILFIPQLLYFMHLDENFVLICVNILLLVIPYYYLHSAYKNFKG